MIKKYTLDMLNENNVSVKTQNFITQDGIEYTIGQPHRKSYINSTRGRAEVEAELPQEQQNAIFAIWGTEPTIIEEIDG